MVSPPSWAECVQRRSAEPRKGRQDGLGSDWLGDSLWSRYPSSISICIRRVWKVFADPGFLKAGDEYDLADIAQGGRLNEGNGPKNCTGSGPALP